jgi:membrane protein implicated in regulation of membrane protease activity
MRLLRGRKRRMLWFKVAAIAAGVVVAFLIVSSVIGFLVEAAIAALVVATVVLAVKVAFYRKQVSRSKHDSELRDPAYSSPLPRYDTSNVDDELARLRREMGH